MIIRDSWSLGGGRCLSFNNEQIHISDVVLNNAAYGSSGLFGSGLGFKYIGHNTCIGKRSNFHSKITPIHGPVHKYDLNRSYSRSHLSRFPQAVAKKLIYSLSQKISDASMMIDQAINGFSTNEVKIHLYIFDYLIIAFGITGFYLGLSYTSHGVSLDRFLKSVVDKVKFDTHV